MNEDTSRFIGLLTICGMLWIAWRFSRSLYHRVKSGLKMDASKFDRYLIRAALIAVILYVLTRL